MAKNKAGKERRDTRSSNDIDVLSSDMFVQECIIQYHSKFVRDEAVNIHTSTVP